MSIDPVVTGDRPVVHRGAWRRALSEPMTIIGLAVLTGVLFVAVFANLLMPADPSHSDLTSVLADPGSSGHLLGTDSAGRDVLSRLISGTRITLLGAALTLFVAVVIGLPGGLVAGYFGRRWDISLSFVADVLMSLPAILVLLALITAIGPNLAVTMCLLGVMISPSLFRMVRATVIGVKDELYVDAARVSGLSDSRIIARHILRAVMGPTIVMLSILAGVAISVQSGLEFLGLGDPTQPTWGVMLSDALASISRQPWGIVWPGLAITLTVAGFILVGNGIRDSVQPSGALPIRKPAPHTSTPEQKSIAALEVRGLTVAYGAARGEDREVVREVSFAVERGRTLGLIGESGSGKSQTSFAILGLLGEGGAVVGGQIWVGGQEIGHLRGRARRRLLGRAIAYVPQEPMSNLDPSFTVERQLTEPMRAAGMNDKDATAKAASLLLRVGIRDTERVLGSYPHQLSGGMAQRVLIAGAISTEPDVLIADEPTTALDVTVQAEILDLLRDLQLELGMALVLVTHDLGVVADICDDVVVMRNGEVIETATLEDFFAGPTHEYSRQLLASSREDELRAPRNSSEQIIEVAE